MPCTALKDPQLNQFIKRCFYSLGYPIDAIFTSNVKTSYPFSQGVNSLFGKTVVFINESVVSSLTNRELYARFAQHVYLWKNWYLVVQFCYTYLYHLSLMNTCFFLATSSSLRSSFGVSSECVGLVDLLFESVFMSLEQGVYYPYKRSVEKFDARADEYVVSMGLRDDLVSGLEKMDGCFSTETKDVLGLVFTDKRESVKRLERLQKFERLRRKLPMKIKEKGEKGEKGEEGREED